MQRAWLALVVLGMALVPAAVRAVEPEPVDAPIVLLDAAKLELAEGRLKQAREQLAQIPLAGAADYVAGEVLFQQLLVNGAFLSATHYLLVELERNALAESAYGQWLAGERDVYAAVIARVGEEYLAAAGGGAQLDFVRFRLPVVTVEHLADTELYTDREILGPAVTNWDDGRDGLGKGLVAGQARVALVLAAARYYDLPSAATSLEEVSVRLTSGVPLDQAAVRDWLAETAELVPEHDGLARLSATIRARRMGGGAAVAPTPALQSNTEEGKASE